jgi:hypothetical protein
MNLLVVSQYFWPESFRINDLVRSLAKRGARVTVLTGKPNYPGGEVFDGYTAGGIVRESLDQVAVLRVPMMPRGRPSGLRLAANYLSFMLSAGFGKYSIFAGSASRATGARNASDWMRIRSQQR